MFGQRLLVMKNRPPHVRESGFWKEGNFCIWYIRNPENLSCGILIFGIRKTAQEEFGTPLTIRSGIQAPVTKNPESRTWNPEIYNLDSWSQDYLGSLKWGEMGGGGIKANQKLDNSPPLPNILGTPLPQALQCSAIHVFYLSALWSSPIIYELRKWNENDFIYH